MMLRGGLLGDYHIMRPGEDFPAQDIVRGPAAPGDAGLWQEPEDARHTGGPINRSPLRQIGLLSSDDEMRAYLQALQQRLQQNDIQRGPATYEDARRGRLWQAPETQTPPPVGFPDEYRYRNPNTNLLNPGGGYSWPGVDMGQN